MRRRFDPLVFLVMLLGVAILLFSHAQATTDPTATKTQGSQDDGRPVSGNPFNMGGVTSGSLAHYNAGDRAGYGYAIPAAMIDSLVYSPLITSNGATPVVIISRNGTLFSEVRGIAFKNGDTIQHTITLKSSGGALMLPPFDIPAAPATASGNTLDNFVALPNEDLVFLIDGAGSGTSVTCACHYIQRR